MPTRPPPRVADPIILAAVTREHLPSIVLTPAQVQAEFPGLPLDSEDTGYQDNEAAAEASLDPDDTGLDLAARGRLDGYQGSFFDYAGLFEGSSSRDQPVAADFSVELFSSSGAAQAFIRRTVQDYRRMQGQEVEEGVTFNQFTAFTAPQVGTDALAGRYNFTVQSLDLEFFGTFIVWRRDNLVLSIVMGATDDRDWAAPAQRLAHLMDHRLDRVLAGGVRAAPIATPTATPAPFATSPPIATSPPFSEPAPFATPAPIPTPAPAAGTAPSGRTGGIPGVALPAMLPTLADLGSGAIIEGDGYVQDTDALSVYEREFAAEVLFFTFGSSQFSNLNSTVELFATPSEASGPVLVLGAMDPQLFGQLAGPALAQGPGFTPENLEVEAIDLPAIGDATAGFVMRVQAATINLDSYMSLSHRPVGELSNTGVGALRLNRGWPVRLHGPLVGPQKGRLLS